MSHAEHPDLGRMAATMSRNHLRLTEIATLLNGRMDDLVAAAARQDWPAVERKSQELAENSRAGGYRVLSGLAERVAEEARQPGHEVAVKRNLIRLIGTHHRVAQPAAR